MKYTDSIPKVKPDSEAWPAYIPEPLTTIPAPRDNKEMKAENLNHGDNQTFISNLQDMQPKRVKTLTRGLYTFYKNTR